MAKLQEYICGDCGAGFEYLHMAPTDRAVCPACNSSSLELCLGGHTFSTIVPVYPGAHRRKAGYVHKYVNRPAEKTYVSVPRGKGNA